MTTTLALRRTLDGRLEGGLGGSVDGLVDGPAVGPLNSPLRGPVGATIDPAGPVAPAARRIDGRDDRTGPDSIQRADSERGDSERADIKQAGIERPAASPAPGSVSFRHVDKVFQSSSGTVRAIEDITLDIEAGSIFGIIGRSGAGKSTLLRTINRLERPTGGQVIVDGQDVGDLGEAELVRLRRRIGMIFQHFNLLSARTVFENVALPLRVAGVATAQVRDRVGELLDLVGLQDKHRTYPSRLSGGQKQRVGIARALATRPQILLCDEATSALDPETTQSILQLLRDINRRLGITIILITHEMAVIREIADRVLVLEQGRIAELGEVWRVFGAPRHPATRALLAPLQLGLPEDLKARLLAEAPGKAYQRVLQLSYNGEEGLEPDLTRIASALGLPVRLIHGGIDRIQGHAQGRLLLALDGRPPLPDLEALTHGADAIAHQIDAIGYLPDVDPDTVHSR